ncbi:hypothetical protein FHT82_000067 [Rhizobium sp. BK275]|uniref:hypothetical protein n=1 Tax=unclassified Rhizobium TaxID=2613769 RepID=UPI0016162DEA|nr:MULTISPECIES: hypothetical protein [unclassified Rhizobium]MBB3387347.1 hypothetical protein [Rhizobium sp. BK275]MBB3406703.1 hypothetical protein [Rhizobium sp. BK316]
MFLFSPTFWLGKSESLAQDLVGSFVKTALIAVFAFVVMEYAKDLMELYDKRRALVQFQNSTVTTTIASLQNSYNTQFGCLATLAQFKKVECLNGLRNFRVGLDSQQDVVSGVLGNQASALETLAASVDALLSAQTDALSSDELARLSKAAKKNLRSAIDELAQEIQ